jgi:hypothetical protein
MQQPGLIFSIFEFNDNMFYKSDHGGEWGGVGGVGWGVVCIKHFCRGKWGSHTTGDDCNLSLYMYTVHSRGLHALLVMLLKSHSTVMQVSSKKPEALWMAQFYIWNPNFSFALPFFVIF